MSKRWSQERIDAILKLRREGNSCKQIAEIIGEGLTKDAVIGWFWRRRNPERVRAYEATKAPQPNKHLKTDDPRRYWDDSLFVEKWADRKKRAA